MSDGWLGFLGGVLSVLVGGLIGSIIQRQNEAKNKKTQAQLSAYFHLLELSQLYFWVVTAEFHNKEPSQDILDRCLKLSIKLSDNIRAFDHIEHLEEILTILFSESVPTANERAKRLEQLLKNYGEIVNPEFYRIVKKISNENMANALGKYPSYNAPGTGRYKR